MGSYMDQLLTVLVSAAGSLIAKVGGASGGGFNFLAPLTATANGTTGNVDVGLVGGSSVESVGGTSPIVSSGGATPTISITAASGASAGSFAAADYTVLHNASASPTAAVLAKRQADGSLVATYYTTANTNVASDGILRLPVGDGDVISIKGASHTSVPLVATANSGSQIVFGDGVEIQGYNVQSGLISQIGPVSFGIGVTPAFSQSQPSGTGSTAGALWTSTGQQGQNVAAGPNNNGGGMSWIAGIPGTGGTGGTQGAFSWQAGGVTMGLGAAGLAVGGGSSVSYVDTPVASAPPNPAAGFIRYYTDGSGHPTVVNSAGSLLDLAGTVAPNRGGTGLSSSGAAGNVLTSTGSVWASSLPASLFFSLDCALTGGTVTQASGKTLTNAVIVSVRLKTPSVAVGAPTAVISGNNVVVTSYTAGAIQAATDGSTYTVVLAGAV